MKTYCNVSRKKSRIPAFNSRQCCYNVLQERKSKKLLNEREITKLLQNCKTNAELGVIQGNTRWIGDISIHNSCAFDLINTYVTQICWLVKIYLRAHMI